MIINLSSLIKATIFGSAILIIIEVFTVSLGFISILASWAASALVGLLYVRYHRQKESVSTSQGALGGELAGFQAALLAGMVGAGVGLLFIATTGTGSAPNLAGMTSNIFNGGFVIVNAPQAAGAGVERGNLRLYVEDLGGICYISKVGSFDDI